MMNALEAMKSARKPSGPILGFLVTIVGFLIAGSSPVFFGISAENSASWAGQLIITCCFIIWIVTIFTWVKVREGRSVLSLGFGRGALGQILTGALAGVAMTSLVVAISVITGQASLSVSDISALGPIIPLLLGFAVQSSAEEIAYRGYLPQALATKWPVALVILVQALAFTLGHIGNGLNLVAVMTMLAVSYFLMMWVLATGNLWAAIAFHTFWNWSQANLWGAAVSNIRLETHVFSFAPRAGSDLITGGSFGLEGSLLTIFFLLLGGGVFHLIWWRRRAA